MKRYQWPHVAAFTALAFFATEAAAHAVLVTSLPAANASLTPAPAQVELHFNEGLEQKFSSVTLADAHGKSVAKASGDASTTDPSVLRLVLPKLAPGEYTVVWSAMTRDSHRTKGHYLFRVQ